MHFLRVYIHIQRIYDLGRKIKQNINHITATSFYLFYLIPIFCYVNVKLFQRRYNVELFLLLNGQLLHGSAHILIANLWHVCDFSVKVCNHLSVLWQVLYAVDQMLDNLIKLYDPEISLPLQIIIYWMANLFPVYTPSWNKNP